MSEHFHTGLKKPGRGMAKASRDLIEAMYAVAEAAQPITGRGIGYKLFTRGLIESMSVNNMQKVYRLLKIAREEGTIPWSWIVDEYRGSLRLSEAGKDGNPSAWYDSNVTRLSLTCLPSRRSPSNHVHGVRRTPDPNDPRKAEAVAKLRKLAGDAATMTTADWALLHPHYECTSVRWPASVSLATRKVGFSKHPASFSALVELLAAVLNEPALAA